jgi:hypothetical protein
VDKFREPGAPKAYPQDFPPAQGPGAQGISDKICLNSTTWA